MRLILILAGTALAAVFAFSQRIPPAPLSCEIRSEDWQFPDWQSVRIGQLSVIHARGGDRLQVYSLSAATLPPMPDRVRSVTQACDGNCFLVSSFDEGVQNRLGGYFSSFVAPPSSARVALAGWDDGRRALTLDYARAGGGYCGMWVHLFDFKQPVADRVYLDAGSFAALSFWIRGREGSERIRLKAADAILEKKEDALPVGEVSSYLPSGKIAVTWQQAVVPLSALPRTLNRRQLASFVFESISGEGRTGVKDLAFCTRSEPLPSLSPAIPSTAVTRASGKALWVWNTAEILPSVADQGALEDFCLREGISDLYLQLPKEKGQSAYAGEITLRPDQWRRFLAALSSKGIRAHALDGFKDYALPEWHARVLATVDNVIRYNRSVEADERFAGIHYDIEPYLLPGFNGPRRELILTGYLELLEKMASRIKSSGLTFGVDIPFWYDLPDELTGSSFRIEFRGSLKLPGEHVMDLVDYVDIMDYRTFAYGADGIIALAEGELQYAAKAGKKVFVGVETNELPDEDLIEFTGEARQGVPEKAPPAGAVVLESSPGGAKFWLVSVSQWENFRRGVDERRAVTSGILWWPVRRAVAVPAVKLTFASLGMQRLQEALLEAQWELSRHPAFAGYAIHDLIGLRKLHAASPAQKAK